MELGGCRLVPPVIRPVVFGSCRDVPAPSPAPRLLAPSHSPSFPELRFQSFARLLVCHPARVFPRYRLARSRKSPACGFVAPRESIGRRYGFQSWVIKSHAGTRDTIGATLIRCSRLNDCVVPSSVADTRRPFFRPHPNFGNQTAAKFNQPPAPKPNVDFLIIVENGRYLGDLPLCDPEQTGIDRTIRKRENGAGTEP